MPKLETWINPVKKINEPIHVAISERFIDPETGEPALWTLTPVDAGRNEQIQEACMEKVYDEIKKTTSKQLNNLKYVNGLTADTVTDPDLRNKDLWKALDPPATSAVDALNKLLNPEEKNDLIKEINKIYKLNPDMLEEMIDDAKNASQTDSQTSTTVQ